VGKKRTNEALGNKPTTTRSCVERTNFRRHSSKKKPGTINREKKKKIATKDVLIKTTGGAPKAKNHHQKNKHDSGIRKKYKKLKSTPKSRLGTRPCFKRKDQSTSQGFAKPSYRCKGKVLPPCVSDEQGRKKAEVKPDICVQSMHCTKKLFRKKGYGRGHNRDDLG